MSSQCWTMINDDNGAGLRSKCEEHAYIHTQALLGQLNTCTE